MPFIGNTPAQVPLTSADIADGIITSAKITDATIVNGDIANSTIALAKLSATGTPSAATFLRGDNAWGEAGAAAGQVIQVVTATDNTNRSTTSSTYVTGSNTLSVTITPSSASNKILIMLFAGIARADGNAAFWTIYKGGSNLFGANGIYNIGRGDDTGDDPVPLGFHYLDSPATTSATTYQVYMKANGGITAYLGYASSSSITVMEIKG